MSETPTERTSEPILRCEDCALPYCRFPLDCVVPDEQWAAIHPFGGGGVLCALCMAARANRRGATVMHASFEGLNGISGQVKTGSATLYRVRLLLDALFEEASAQSLHRKSSRLLDFAARLAAALDWKE